MCASMQELAEFGMIQQMPTSQPNSCQLDIGGSWVFVKQPGPESPCHTRTPGMIIACVRSSAYRALRSDAEPPLARRNCGQVRQ